MALQQLFRPIDGALHLIFWLELEVWEQLEINAFMYLTAVILFLNWVELPNYRTPNRLQKLFRADLA